VLHCAPALQTRSTLMDKRPSWATRTVRTPENMEKTSDDPCCVVLIDLLGSIPLNMASGIVWYAFFAFRLAIPPLQFGRCATVEARGLLPADELHT
ncbi:hypothetical protein AVEN_150792-1, partial [Araneus ventricosus]